MLQLTCLRSAPDQLKEYEPVKPDEGLAGRIQMQIGLEGELSRIAFKLDITDEILALFPQQPPERHLHIVVQRPVGTRKRFRSHSPNTVQGRRQPSTW